MRVLVTGGAGFIGSHLCRRLLAEGHTVSVIDNELNGRRECVPAGAKFTLADVVEPAGLEPVFAQGLDAVCHIAGQVSIIRSFSDPVADLRTNVEGTLNVLKLCLKYKVPRLVYASSMTLYGQCETIPTPESEPCRPDSYYGITKHAAERYVHSTAERPDLGFDFSVTSLRMFSVYGPGQSFSNPYQGVLGIFSGNLLRGEPITIFGDGMQTRDFIYIDDIVEASMRLIKLPQDSSTCNLGSGVGYSVNHVRAIVEAVCGKELQTIYRPARGLDVRSVVLDNTRLNARLGWQPAIGLTEGVARTWNWLQHA